MTYMKSSSRMQRSVVCAFKENIFLFTLSSGTLSSRKMRYLLIVNVIIGFMGRLASDGKLYLFTCTNTQCD